MPIVASIGLPRVAFLDQNGRPAIGGRVWTYLAGSTTLATTYADATGMIVNPNPVPLDERGECVLWYDESLTYKLAPEQADGTALPVQDNLTAGFSSDALTAALAMANAAVVTATNAANAAVAALAAAGVINPVTLDQLNAAVAPKANTADLSAYAPIATPTFQGNVTMVGNNLRIAPVGAGFAYFETLSPHLAFYKKTGSYDFYWRRTDDGSATGANPTQLLNLNDSGNLTAGGLLFGRGNGGGTVGNGLGRVFFVAAGGAPPSDATNNDLTFVLQ